MGSKSSDATLKPVFESLSPKFTSWLFCFVEEKYDQLVNSYLRVDGMRNKKDAKWATGVQVHWRNLEIFQIFHSNWLVINQKVAKSTFQWKQNQLSATKQDIPLKKKICYKKSTN